ncbi:MAG: TonB-dependent receptor [Nonlabens sp.]
MLFYAGNCFSQLVTVIDSQTAEPIAFVSIYDDLKSSYTSTNIKGEAQLGDLASSEVIIFKLIGYLPLRTTIQELKSAGFLVKLVSSTESMETVVLSASKFKQRKKEIPQKIFSLNKDDVLAYNPQTSADLLQQSGQVFVQKSQQGGGSPLIRGFSTNRLLITVDGVRMNNAIFRGGNLQNVISIDPLSVERSEVILGPGSVVYGSDAIGGVMNFYTLRPQIAQDTTLFSGNALARYASANREKTVHADFNLGTNRFASATSITVNFFEDLTMGRHGPDEYLRPILQDRISGQDVVSVNSNPRRQVPTGYDQLNLLQKFRYQASSNWDLSLGLIYTTTGDFDRFDSLNRFRESGIPRNAEWYYGPQQWFMANLRATHNSDNKWYDRAIYSQSYQRFNESRNTRDFNEPELFENDETVDAIITSADFERRGKQGNALYYGAEFVHNRVGSTGSMFNIETGQRISAASRYPDDATWESLAFYANYQWKLLDALTLQTGLRYNHIWIDAQFDNMLFNLPFEEAHLNTGAFTGAVGATYTPGSRWELRANFSTAFRAPNIDDIGKIFDPSPGTVIVPNPDLESEYSYNTELGASYRIDDLFQIEIAGFYTFLQDVLVARDFDLNGNSFIDYQGNMSRIQAIQNEQQAQVYGIEMGLRSQLTSRLSIVGHYTIMAGEQEEEDGSKVAVRHLAPNFGDFHLIYNSARLNLDAFVNFNGQFDFEDLAPRQQSRPYLYAIDGQGNPISPRWYTINLRSRYLWNSSIATVVTLENITDQRYRTYSSGIAAAGRNLIVALNYSF